MNIVTNSEGTVKMAVIELLMAYLKVLQAFQKQTNLLWLLEQCNQTVFSVMLLFWQIKQFSYQSSFWGKNRHMHMKHDEMFIVLEKRHRNTSSNPGRGCCIDHSTHILSNGMHPIIFPPAMGN